jgi:tetratricopeptide (TPR) repeat protein
MKLQRNFVSIVARGALIAISILGSCASADPVQLREVSTPLFTLYTTETESGARKTAEALINLDRVARRTAGAATQDVVPTRIFVVSSKDWDAVFKLRRGLGGFFFGGTLSSDIVVPVSSDLREVVFHEYMHHLLHDQTQLIWPAWFGEGVSQLLSNMEFKGDRATFKPPRDLMRYMTNVRWIPIRTMLNVDRTSNEYRSHTLAASFYAQSWVMAHYAFVENPAALRQTMDFILRTNRGQSVDEALPAFGQTYDELDAKFVRYRNRLQFRDGELRIPSDSPPVAIEQRTLDPIESLIAYLELGVRLRFDAKQMMQLVPESTRAKTEEPHLLALLAVMAQQAGKPDEADAYIARAPQHAAKADLRTQVLMGDVYFERADQASEAAGSSTPEAEALYERARTHYRQAMTLNSKDLEAIYSFSLTCRALHTQCAEALERLEMGLALAPRNTLLLSAAAATSDRLGMRTQAQQYWKSVHRFAQDEDTKREAAHALGLVEAPSPTPSE